MGSTPVRMALFGYGSSAPFLAPIRPLVPAHVIASRMALVSCFPLVISFSLVSLIPFDFLRFIVLLFRDPELAPCGPYP